jgi:hypothetical protein
VIEPQAPSGVIEPQACVAIEDVEHLADARGPSSPGTVVRPCRAEQRGSVDQRSGSQTPRTFALDESLRCVRGGQPM